jgi:hypothetical protein
MNDFDFDSNGFFDVNGYVEHLELYNNNEPQTLLSDKDLKAAKASKRTWADVFDDEDEA